MNQRQVERSLHKEIMLRLKAWPVITIPVPNGIWIPARTDAERAVGARIINMMKSSGQLLPGAPDLLVLWNGGCAMLELKAPSVRSLLGATRAGRASESQIEMAELAHRLGVNHSFATSWDEVKSCLIRWGAPRPLNMAAV